MKRFAAGVLAGTTILALTGGCTVEQFGSKLEILKAAQDLATARRAGFTVTAGGRVEDLIATAKKEAAAGGHTITAQETAALRGVYQSALTVAWDKAGKPAADDRFLAAAVVAGVEGPELRVVDEVTYARVPFRQLAAKFGGSKADIAEIRQVLGPRNAGVDTLIDGGWVRVDAADMEKFVKQNLDGAAANPDPKLADQFATALTGSAVNLIESARVSHDPKDETHLTITTSVAKVQAEAERLVAAAAKLAGEPAADLVDAGLRKAPADRPIVLDLWIENGRFDAFEINLLQFVPGSTGRAGVRVDFTRGVGITAPAHADRLDLNKVFRPVTGGKSWTLGLAPLGG